jgi:hypothetical protein
MVLSIGVRLLLRKAAAPLPSHRNGMSRSARSVTQRACGGGTKRRGLKDPLLVTSGGAPGIIKAIETRAGDHIWWITDVRRFQRHYPAWGYMYDLFRVCYRLSSQHRKNVKSASNPASRLNQRCCNCTLLVLKIPAKFAVKTAILGVS